MAFRAGQFKPVRSAGSHTKRQVCLQKRDADAPSLHSPRSACRDSSNVKGRPAMTTSYELSQSVETTQQRSEWARLYAQAHQQYPEVIRMLRQRASGDTIADIGCGPGASVPICQA